MTMSESEKGGTGRQPDVAALAEQTPPLEWRRNSMGLGMFAFIVALFAAACPRSGAQAGRRRSLDPNDLQTHLSSE